MEPKQVTTLGLSGPGSNGKKGLLQIPQRSGTIRLSDISRTLVWGSNPSGEMQSVYSTAPTMLF